MPLIWALDRQRQPDLMSLKPVWSTELFRQTVSNSQDRLFREVVSNKTLQDKSVFFFKCQEMRDPEFSHNQKPHFLVARISLWATSMCIPECKCKPSSQLDRRSYLWWRGSDGVFCVSSINTLVKISKSAGAMLKPHAPKLIPALLESLSVLEPQVLNYLSLRATEQEKVSW